MDLTLKTEYWGDLPAREAFKKFILEIHGLDFSPWESHGYWDDAYTPFSFFEGDRVVASVCIYLLDALIDGEPTCLAQISGVGTLPEWRRRGINRELTDIGLQWARGKQSGLFLFSDTDAIPFYERCGFAPAEEYIEIVEATPLRSRGGTVRLDPGKKPDLDKIYRYAERRSPISNRFSVLNAKLTMFHVLYYLGDHAYEIPDLGCIIFYKRTEGRLDIFDILGESIPPLKDLYPYIADDSDKVIEFHFNTDKLGLDGVRTRPLFGNHLFVRGTFPVDRPVFPYTSRA